MMHYKKSPYVNL